MNSKKPKGKIGILPVMLDLYNRLAPDLAAKLEGICREVTEGLVDEGFDIVRGDLACTGDQISKGIEQLESEDIDLFVLAHPAYCPSGEIYPALRDLDVPLVLWPMQEMYELVPESFDNDQMRSNHGVHGTQDLSNILRRAGMNYGVIHGHWKQEKFRRQLVEWARAGRIYTKMLDSNPLQIGGHFEGMLDLQIDVANCGATIGIEPCVVTDDELAELIRQADKDWVQQRVSAYRDEFTIGEGVTAEMLGKAARGEWAIRECIKRYKASAFGINFVSLCNDERIDDPLHVAASVLAGEGFGYGAEGDWLTAATGAGLGGAFDQLSFTEIFSVDYKGGRVVLRHWGEGDIRTARGKARLIKSQFNDQRRMTFATTGFEFKAGVADLINFNITPEGKGQIISISGRIEKEALPKVAGVRGIFRPENSDICEVLTRYAKLGGSHHLTLVYDNTSNAPGKLAELTGWEYYGI